MWWKKNKWKVIIPLVVVVVLAFAFWYGGGAPGLQGWSVDKEVSASAPTPAPSDESVSASADPSPAAQDEAAPTEDENESPADAETAPETSPESEDAEETPESEAEPEASPEVEASPEPAEEPTGLDARPGGAEGGMSVSEKLAAAAEIAAGAGIAPLGDASYSEENGMHIDPATGKDKYMTDPVPEGKPVPVEPEDVEITDTAYKCTISISCKTILDNISWLDPEKVELVPEDGWILEPIEVTFYDGESVFNVLQRTCKQNKIHMEFSNNPLYHSAYIEGIHNLYEFDCGDLSGWMYKVNEWFPNYGCSRYQLKDGDVICWEYTCNLGIDVGGYYAMG